MRAELARGREPPRRFGDGDPGGADASRRTIRACSRSCATSHYLARDYEQGGRRRPRRCSQSSPTRRRCSRSTARRCSSSSNSTPRCPALERAVALDASDAAARVALGRAYVLAGEFAPRHSAARAGARRRRGRHAALPARARVPGDRAGREGQTAAREVPAAAAGRGQAHRGRDAKRRSRRRSACSHR